MRFFFLFLIALLIQPLTAQETAGEAAGSETATGTAAEPVKPAVDDSAFEDDSKAESEADADAAKKAAEDKKAEEEKIESLNKEKRDVILYGIDTEVQDVLSTIRTQKDLTFNDDLLQLLSTNSNTEINRAIYDFFNEMEISIAEAPALELLRNHLDDYEYSNKLLLSAISYLGTIESEVAGDLFYSLLEDNNKSIASSALRGIGRLKDGSRVAEIMDLVDEYSGDAEYSDFSATAIAVLGELDYKDAQVFLEDLLQDEDASSAQRQNAAISIGMLQHEDGLKLLKTMYSNSEDSLLRSYILLGITKYENPEVETILITALRDAFWRIRVAAAQGLGERKTSDAVSILQYKVRKDPVRHVRYASMKALAEIGGEVADKFILEQFEGVRVAFDLRQKALDMMMEYKINGSIDSLEKVLRPKWSLDKDNELGPFCKTLSNSEWDSLKPFYVEMMAHNDFILKIYGIRGVKLNKIVSLKDAVRAMDNEKEAVNVRREAKAALESF
ncbi:MULTISPECIES: HEAT repeat domain-containing protein [unclassified Oceanispirochaeta]|uniref:HEAT repeat domain-containing protein n=1 Tax=unclassified Oceanispirochaeta TaxID=2635722 RepID=UPI000E0934D0|nr:MULTISPECIES: HEAT repeat domain-containing protein [unclassified Oceanispirochaeta]MBF9017234.1 HEAT repeat domain-containing protein [Oceanispirochaeta sp. M2]NPD73683.1 HEAT repeat domain-containing protein [Oceanispirochaeta sp. M1]RDG30611.1 HEAT repeat domain-containing protein [Oceanispirochaeta sp. M1]